MLKKILTWIAFTGFIGLMVFGAVNRTSAKTDRNLSKPIRSEEGSEPVQAKDGSGNKSQTVGSGRNGQSDGSGSNGQVVDHGEDLHEITPEDNNRLVLTGSIIELDSSSLTIQLEDAEILVIEGRGWRYTAESGYSPDVGNNVKVTGFFEDGEYKVSVIQDLSSGQSYTLRGETGRPLWSGAGKKSDL